MTSDAVHTALNVLALIEDEDPDLHHRLRRLLPALAQDFAKAGQHLSERELYNLVQSHKENDQALHSLFKQRARRAAAPSQRDVVRRLNTRLKRGTRMSLHDHIQFGHVEAVEKEISKQGFTHETLLFFLGKTARYGHYPLTKFFIEQTANKNSAIAAALYGAAVDSGRQHHIVLNIINDYGDRHGKIIKKTRELFFPIDMLADYESYERLRARHLETDDYPDEIFAGLEKLQNINVPMREYIKIRDMLAYEEPDIARRNYIAFKAAMVFQSADRVLRYLDRWGIRGPAPLFTLINNIRAPEKQENIDWRAWGNAFLEHGPSFDLLVSYAAQMPRPLYNKKKVSLRLTRNHIWHHFFPRRAENKELAQLCFDLCLENKIFESALELWNKRTDRIPPAEKTIPPLQIDGREFGLPGYTLRQLEDDDLRVLFLGKYTGCCERVGGRFQDTISLALQTRESGYYVLTDEKDNIRLHSWIWRGESGQFVIDGYESEDPAIKTKHLVALTTAIAQRLGDTKYAAYKITDVILGKSSYKFAPHDKLAEAPYPAIRYACKWYYTSNYNNTKNQWLVRRITDPALLYPAVQKVRIMGLLPAPQPPR